MGNPLVSFILISYKHKAFIKDCMESILNQSYSNMEILYLDDASGDGTFQEAEKHKTILEEKYSKVLMLENGENCGVVKNLNRLISMSEGKYVKFLAADDFMLQDGIEKMVDFMENHSEYDMIYSNGIIGNEENHYKTEIEISISETLEYKEEPPNGNDIFDLLYERDFISAPGVMVKRSIYDKIGLYDEQIGVEDWDFFLRVAKEGAIGYLKEPTHMYRMLSTSLSHSALPHRRMNMKKSELLILEKHKDIAGNAQERMKIALNEALADAFYIDDKEYLSYLYLYAKRNKIQITFLNQLKKRLYQIGIFKLV